MAGMLAECPEGKLGRAGFGARVIDGRAERAGMATGKVNTGEGNRDQVGKKVYWRAEYNCCVLANGGGAGPLYL